MEFKVKRIEFGYEENVLTHIICEVKSFGLFDIEICDFYCYMSEKDTELKNYSSMFETWDELTNDLVSLEFDFVKNCEDYINNQFSDEEVEDFCY
jgi:hypothetical protein